MKILVVAREHYFRQSMVIALQSKLPKAEVICADHPEALGKFLTESPSHVVVCDYDEYGDGTEDYCRGRQTWQDIKNSSTTEVVIRCGLSRYDYPDYIPMPFEIERLVDLLTR